MKKILLFLMPIFLTACLSGYRNTNIYVENFKMEVPVLVLLNRNTFEPELREAFYNSGYKLLANKSSKTMKAYRKRKKLANQNDAIYGIKFIIERKGKDGFPTQPVLLVQLELVDIQNDEVVALFEATDYRYGKNNVFEEVVKLMNEQYVPKEKKYIIKKQEFQRIQRTY
ncbi:MAG: hypothetical protein ACTSXL_03870 [Alphaproteobacteria bacterium]